ncbi:MAG: CDP-glucose 4,6-dehydratase [Chloroflexi bacterium]|nr:CDP-glucose 4,6-dehydratase [Chloroflexota bacterium]|tara:strand:+ start:3727 stop:4803 length:1077 start_codon:yes stop_codon:yes gene_type:complete
MNVDTTFWHGKRVLLTGHTGFKGSWLSLWLQSMGTQVQGFALQPPTQPALFEQARVAEGMASTIGDVRDREAVLATFQAFKPEIVIHMAAQPLVRLSYEQPVETYATNVMGTVHVLDAARQTDSVRAIVNVTTDKCYENKEWVWGYREDEPMGGHDPYSNSKGCSELVTAAYRKSFFNARGVALASGRAGNVIGGGDWALDRLVPDVLRAFERDAPVRIRNPHSIRPWQHVLEPLSGYLVLAQTLYTQGASASEAWNFGPRDDDAKPVQWIVENLVQRWGRGARWAVDEGNHPHEAHYLKLDISKAGSRLGWQPAWTLDTALARIVDWQQAWLDKQDVREVCLRQIAQYMNTKTKETV